MRKPEDIIINGKTLKEILENHKHWIDEDCEGWESMKADLSYSNLSESDLSDSDLRGSNLSNSNLRYSNLRGSNFHGSDLRGSNLRGSNLDECEKIRKGLKIKEPMVGWKKCQNNVLVKLEIPRGAIVFSINNNKCRTDKAIVKEIIGADRAFSKYTYFSYYVGDVIEVFNFNCEYNAECAEGIHFFRTREEAENYTC